MFSSLKKSDDVDIQFIDAPVKRLKPVKSEPVKKFPVNVVNNNTEIQIGEDNNFTKITLHRTLRIPDDGKVYPLPPSLGKFPIHKVDDFKDSVPEKWLKTGGVFFPMYQREAMWLEFKTYNSHGIRPKAVKVAVGKVNVITGRDWKNELSKTDQDYVVLPDQKWLDGIKSSKGAIKQFIAMPLHSGHTVESQLTGKDEFGGVQIIVYENKNIFPRKNEEKDKKKPAPSPVVHVVHNKGKSNKGGVSFKSPQPKKSRGRKKKGKGIGLNIFKNLKKHKNYDCDEMIMECQTKSVKKEVVYPSPPSEEAQPSQISYDEESEDGATAPDMGDVIDNDNVDKEHASEMGIGVGGTMKQKIFKDTYGYNSFNHRKFGRVFVHIVNSQLYREITKKEPPECPIDAQTYTNYGYPWYNLYEEGKEDVETTGIFDHVKSVKTIDNQSYAYPQQDDDTVYISDVQEINPGVGGIRDGKW